MLKHSVLKNVRRDGLKMKNNDLIRKCKKCGKRLKSIQKICCSRFCYFSYHFEQGAEKRKQRIKEMSGL
jgi:hypothetical protein